MRIQFAQGKTARVMECWLVDEMRPFAEEFAATGYVELTPLFTTEQIRGVTAHAAAAVEFGGRRRDITVGVTGDSPRRYRLAGRSAIDASGRDIQRVYRDTSVLALLARVTGMPVHAVPYAPEEYIVTRFEEPGDTHGWHWDDYSFALIWVTKAPAASDGGSLEFVSGVAWNKAHPDVERHVAAGPIHTRHPVTGTVYLLRADTMLHRVTPLKREVRREIACLSYATHADLERAVSHETLEQLYAVG